MMELRSAVSIARPLVHCFTARQHMILLPVSQPTAFFSLANFTSNGAVHRLMNSQSMSSYTGSKLKMLGSRREMFQSGTDCILSEVESSISCVGLVHSTCAGNRWANIGSVRGMAGHSKWANIRHIKAAKDQQKSRVINEYTRKLRALIRETGQTDPKTSSQLARLITDAKSKNVPSSNIDRILTQMSNLKNCPPVMFTAKGPAGSVMLIEALTDKMNQTRAELQSIVKKCGFSLFDAGSLGKVAFEEKGLIQISCSGEVTPDLEGYVDIAIEAGAEDVSLEEEEDGSKVLQFVCEAGEVYAVKKELEARQLAVSSAEVVYTPSTTVSLDPARLELIAKAMDKLDDHHDVLRVYINVQEASS